MSSLCYGGIHACETLVLVSDLVSVAIHVNEALVLVRDSDSCSC